MNIVASFDPTKQILTIYGTTPGATIVVGGTPLLPPPTATATDTPAPSNTPWPTYTRPPQTVAPSATSTPAPAIVNAATLTGKIVFKSARDGGSYPDNFQYYAMNADGSDLQKLDFDMANVLALTRRPREGISPDGKKIVVGEPSCGAPPCNLYILDTVQDAQLIQSGEAPSHGTWFEKPGFKAYDPVWSPASTYIAFVSNHNPGPGCGRTANIFKKAPTQNAPDRRLTSFCASGNIGRPTFSPDGTQLAFWSEDPGPFKQIYVLNVGADDTADFRVSNPHIISDGQADDWDPLWIK